MSQEKVLEHEFVEFIPEKLEEGTLYVCVSLAIVVHECCCGCGNEVVTPLSPTDWKLTFDGETISLHPSIGNWSFKCRSHYWIRNNRVTWAPKWSQRQIEASRAHDRSAKERYFDADHRAAGSAEQEAPSVGGETSKGKQSFWQKLRRWWS
jgi:hypothetical protein